MAPGNIAQARYDTSYRVSANFLNWVTNTYDDQVVAKLNAPVREGRYREELWQEYTGHEMRELADNWKESLVTPPDSARSNNEEQ